MTRHVVLVAGAPGSGKSTYARALGLPHLEREQYASDEAFKDAVVAACEPDEARVVVVRCCPTVREQETWRHVMRATDVVVMPTSQAECRRRVMARGRERWRSEMHGVTWWFHARNGEPA